MINKILKLADLLDKQSQYTLADTLTKLAKDLPKTQFAIPPKHKKNKDGKGHFPLNTLGRARNALARANQYDAAPEWWDGSLKALKQTIAKAVKAAYPSINVTKAATD